MPEAIPASHRDLLQKKAVAHLACHLKDGSILVNPVWCAEDGEAILINSAEGRLKDRAMRRNPQVTLCISDPDNPFRYLEVRGRIADVTTEGAEEAIDRLAQKYLGVDTYPNRRPGEVRVSYHVEPEKVVAFGR